MNNMRNKILSLLVLLLTAASGAWADGTVYNTTVALKDLKAGDVLTDGFKLTTNKGQYIYVKGYKKDGGTAETGDYTQLNAYNSTFPGGVTISESGSTYTPYADGKDANAWIVSDWKDFGSATMLYLDGYNYTSAPEPALTVDWNASTKTGTFQMPGSDVVLTPQYAPVAKWDVVETVPQLPAALEGIIAGQDAAIVTPGQSAQGTVMYAVTTTAEAAPALTAFSATVPTAKTYDDATTLYVWYYIQGHDTPDGQPATEENTFNDSEISATPLKVDILTNKFDLTLKPAPVKNMTVTVAGQAKTPTDQGKVTGVKMESEVKLKANTGYKFRKVEVKKAPKQ